MSYQEIIHQLGNAGLVAVGKNYPIEDLKEVYQAGCRDFGESRVQEIIPKMEALPADCRWHFIGTLQKNKVNKLLEKEVYLIHSVDALDLAQKISDVKKESSILLQVNTSGEASKQGLSPDQWEKCMEKLLKLPNLRIKGLMTMAPLTEDRGIIRRCFRSLYELKEKWKNEMKEPAAFCHLSMGMSQDYKIAIEEGATLVRIGTAIFNKDK